MTIEDTEPLICQITNEKDELTRRVHAARAERRGAKAAPLSIGARIADRVAATVGSWPFIIIQSVLLLGWITINLTAAFRHWDPYPFILLNLALSFQAAYAAPFIMMSQNRQATIDRAAAERAYDLEIEAELEIELLHKKLELLRSDQIAEMLKLIRELHKQTHVET